MFVRDFDSSSSFQSEADMVLIERNREDIVYGALRTVSYVLTNRLALNKPLAAIVTKLGVWITIVFLIIGISSAVTKFNI
jgi:hypothetical protein